MLLTRSQEIAVEAQQEMPPGALRRVESSLRASPAFRVVLDTGDATVFALADPEGDR